MSTNYFHRRLKIRLMGKTKNSGFVVPVAFVLFAGGGGGGGRGARESSRLRSSNPETVTPSYT